MLLISAMDLIHSKSLDPWSNFFFTPGFWQKLWPASLPLKIYTGPQKERRKSSNLPSFFRGKLVVKLWGRVLLRLLSGKAKTIGTTPFHVGSQTQVFFCTDENGSFPMIPNFSRNRHLKNTPQPNSNDFDRISYIFLKSFWISLPINAKKTPLLFCDSHTFAAPFGA